MIENKIKNIKFSDIKVNYICNQSKQFMDASLRCYSEPISDGILEGPITPAIVCNAFAVELWLKALYGFENPKGFIPHGHNLLALFKKLTNETKIVLLNLCECSIEEFELTLGKDADSFESWRYAYEHGAGSNEPVNALSVNFVFLRKLGAALNTMCEDSFEIIT